MKVCIIGHGTIGSLVARKMKERRIDEIDTVDKKEEKRADWLSVGEILTQQVLIPEHCPVRPDVYIICVWNAEQVLEVVKQIEENGGLSNHPLISIETTAEMGTWRKAKSIVGDKADVIAFPERVYPNDEFHSVFNQPRVMGGDIKRGKEFYLRYMIPENIILAREPALAELSHILDNSYRYVTIAIAEELKMLLGKDFEEVRRLCNTKWNVEIPEARSGIKGHCLPKDLKLFCSFFVTNNFFRMAEKINELYMERNK